MAFTDITFKRAALTLSRGSTGSIIDINTKRSTFLLPLITPGGG